MEARATLKNIGISPRKVRMVLDLIRGKDVNTAFAYLNATHRGAVPIIRELLKSAVANADNLYPGTDVDSLKIVTAYADAGATLKRFQPRAMGRGMRILKRTSHVTLVVGN
ncbi:MAG: 50S ribosomal protein L22 [SAR324 cluster bacterium]|nr:50S ribosomal protein L22 [SAR324 cluster bacterium]